MFKRAWLAVIPILGAIFVLFGCSSHSVSTPDIRAAAEEARRGAEAAAEGAKQASSNAYKASQEVSRAAAQIKELNPAVQIERLADRVVELERQLAEEKQASKERLQEAIARVQTAPVWLIYQNGIKSSQGVKRVEVVNRDNGVYKVFFDGEFDGREYAAVTCRTDHSTVDRFEQKERTSIVVVITGQPEFDISLCGAVFRQATTNK